MIRGLVWDREGGGYHALCMAEDGRKAAIAYIGAKRFNSEQFAYGLVINEVTETDDKWRLDPVERIGPLPSEKAAEARAMEWLDERYSGGWGSAAVQPFCWHPVGRGEHCTVCTVRSVLHLHADWFDGDYGWILVTLLPDPVGGLPVDSKGAFCGCLDAAKKEVQNRVIECYPGLSFEVRKNA